MDNEISPNGKYSLDFKPNGEVGMGGPMIGEISINGIYLGDDFMSSWIWSDDSKKVLLLLFIGRQPDRTQAHIYDLETRILSKCNEEFGYTFASASFDGDRLIYDSTQLGVRVLTLAAMLDA